MRRMIGLVAALGLVLGALAVGGSPVSAGLATPADVPKVALFYNDAYVDTSEDGRGEAYNMLVSLQGLGFDVTTFTGIADTDFAAALVGADVLVIPELERDDQLGADMSPAARNVVAEWVAAGGRIEVFGSSNPWPTINAIFLFAFVDAGNSVCQTLAPGEPGCERTVAAAGTEFAGGPAQLLYSDDTYGAPTSLPPGSVTAYQDAAIPGAPGAGVAVIPFGAGSIVFFAFDWYGTTNDESPDWDTNWDVVLGLSIDVTVSIDDVTVTEGQTAVFTISTPGPVSQDLVVLYSTGNGTALDGVDYVGQASTAVIPAGSTSVTVEVPTNVVAGEQGSREFFVNVEAPFFGYVVGGAGVGTILDTPSSTTTTAAPVVRPVTPTFTG